MRRLAVHWQGVLVALVAVGTVINLSFPLLVAPTTAALLFAITFFLLIVFIIYYVFGPSGVLWAVNLGQSFNAHNLELVEEPSSFS